MCGRYSLTQPVRRLLASFGLSPPEQWKPRFNIAPGQEAPIIGADRRPRLVMMRWGLVPSWAKVEANSAKLINARAESLVTRPAFRTFFAVRRCLVLADGYYEWARDRFGKQPVRLVLANRQRFTFAGIWDRRIRSDVTELRTFAIITTRANDLVRVITTRMPAILDESDYGIWLTPKPMSPQLLLPLLRPYPVELMACYPVDPLVNDPAHDCRACIEAVPLRRPAKQPQPGQLVRVHHCPHAYRLPDGLEPGTLVKLLAWQPGQWTVEANGCQWVLSMTNVDPGEECFVAGEWWHESHQIAQQELARLAKWTRC